MRSSVVLLLTTPFPTSVDVQLPSGTSLEKLGEDDWSRRVALEATGTGYFYEDLPNAQYLFGGANSAGCGTAQRQLTLVLPKVLPYVVSSDGYSGAVPWFDLDIVNRSSNPNGSQSQPTSIRLFTGADFKPMSKGEALNADHCARCHGFDATGLSGTSLVDKSYGPGTHPNSVFIDSIKNGKTFHCKKREDGSRPDWSTPDCVPAHPYEGRFDPMPAYASILTDSEVDLVITYLRWLQVGSGTCQ